jgi:hypothetical protein
MSGLGRSDGFREQDDAATPDGVWYLHPASAPLQGAGRGICPHCWEVNPGAFRLCARCGADMRTILQESGGLRRTAPVQSPVPVGVSARLGLVQRAVLGGFVLLLALSYLVYLLPHPAPANGTAPAPAGQEH